MFCKSMLYRLVSYVKHSKALNGGMAFCKTPRCVLMRSIVNSNEATRELTRDEASEGTLRFSPRHKKCSKTVAAAVSAVAHPIHGSGS